MSQDIRIQFTRFSAFYSPLIATMAGGFLEQEGLRARHSVSAPGTSAITGLVDGSVHVAQSAPSQGFGPLEQGKTPPALHFAQINEMDGFFLVGRAAEPQFSWDRLNGRKARAWVISAPAAEIAKAEAPFFPDVDPGVLTTTIATYQTLGNWTPHVEITRPAWEATVDIFLHAGLIKRRHRYEDVIASPPGAP